MKRMQQAGAHEFLRRVHERPKRHLYGWLDIPAHIHHTAYRFTNPPSERPQSREEFRHVLQCLEIADENSVIHEKLGYGARTEADGDRLIVVWEAHTEYYSYQVWHIPNDKTKTLTFGPITFPNYHFPVCPLGVRVNALDIVISMGPDFSQDQIREMMPERIIYGNRVFGENISIVSNFTLDDQPRERSLVFSSSPEALRGHLHQIVHGIATIENYYHLILLPFPAFSRAIDQIHEFEQRHLKQQALITGQLSTSTSKTLQHCLTELTEDFMKVSRLAEAMRYQLSAAVPYDSIIRATLQALQERPFPPFRPLSDYVLGLVSGVADGYQQLIRRIDALQAAFEGTIAIIRTRVDLLLEEQNLTLLGSVDQTTKSQAILQRTVEALSIIVITYYLTGLANYVFEALQQIGWLQNATYATALFVPVAVVTSFALTILGRKIINKRLLSDRQK